MLIWHIIAGTNERKSCTTRVFVTVDNEDILHIYCCFNKLEKEQNGNLLWFIKGLFGLASFFSAGCAAVFCFCIECCECFFTYLTFLFHLFPPCPLNPLLSCVDVFRSNCQVQFYC